MRKRVQSRTRPDNNHFGARFNMMTAFVERANLVASYLLFIAVLRRRREREARGKRRFWIREILKKEKSLEHTIRMCKSFDWAIENFTSG